MLCENNISIVDVYEKIFSRRNLRKQKYTRLFYILNDCYNFHQIQLLGEIFSGCLLVFKYFIDQTLIDTDRFSTVYHRIFCMQCMYTNVN